MDWVTGWCGNLWQEGAFTKLKLHEISLAYGGAFVAYMWMTCALCRWRGWNASHTYTVDGLYFPSLSYSSFNTFALNHLPLAARLRNATRIERGGTAEMQRWSEARRFLGRIVVEEREEALRRAKGWKGSDTVWTGGSRQDTGEVGAACVWETPGGWTGCRYHLGSNKEVFDAEVFAVYRALSIIEQRQERERRYTIFVDSTSAIARVGDDSLGPGQRFARSAAASSPTTTASPSGGSQHTAGRPATRWRTSTQRVRPPGRSRWRPYLRDTRPRRPFRT